MTFSRGSSQARDRTCISYISCISRQVPYHFKTLNSPFLNSVFLSWYVVFSLLFSSSFFFFWYDIPLSGVMAFGLSTHQLIAIWVIFCLLAIVNSTAVNIHVQVFEYLCTSFGYMYPRAAGSYSNVQSNLCRKHQTVYYSNHFTFPTSSVWRMSYWLLHMENVNKALIKLFLLHGEMTFLNRND